MTVIWKISIVEIFVNNLILNYKIVAKEFGICFNILDIDECTQNHGGCDINAKCTNTQGGHICECNSGYDGDGGKCTGKLLTT